MLPMFLLALHQMRYSEYLTSINQPIQQLLNTTKFSDVQLLVHDPYKNKSEILDGICRTVSEVLPTSNIFLNNSIPAKLPFIYASRETLMLFIYFSNNCLNFQQSANIIDIITFHNNTPKVLLMTILEEENCNFLSLFEQMWKNHVLNVMILEVPKFKEDQSALMIHQYNPYTQIYDRQPYNSSVEWFPNKLKNLYGYPIKAYVFERIGVLNLKTDCRGNITIDGPDANILHGITQALNATSKLFHHEKMIPTNVWMKMNDIDITMVALPLFHDENFLSLGSTLPLFFERWCPVVPIIRQSNTFVIRDVIAISFNCVVILIVWGISVILKFDKKSWRPLKIFGILIAASVSMKPKRLIEKAMILCLILVSSIYTTNLFADLTATNLQGSPYIVYKDFKELDNSGLVPMMLNLLYNVTFVNHDSYLAVLKKKALIVNSSDYCIDYLAKYKNGTCFLEHNTAKALIYSYARRGENVMTVCKDLCYAEPPVGYFMRKNSVYTERINEVLIRLQASGIFEKWYIDYRGKFSLKKTHYMNIEEQVESSLAFSLIRIGGCGCLLAFLVFCAEIIINRIEKKKKNNEYSHN